MNKGNAPVDDLFCDDNLATGAELDELIDTGNDSLNAFAYDFAFAHTDDK